jgi:hypothetical protein
MDCHDVDSVRLRVSTGIAFPRLSLWLFKAAELIRAYTKPTHKKNHHNTRGAAVSFRCKFKFQFSLE